MKYLPILIDIRNQDVLVVGGGHLAARKAGGAVRAGAKVTVLGAVAAPSMAALIADAGCRHLDEPFAEDHLRGVRMVFAATEDEDLAKRVSRAAREAGIPVNVADRTALCSFIMPATVDRDPIVIAVSSGGDAPILTRSLRARLETLLPAELGEVAQFVTANRGRIAEAFPDFDARRRFWDRFIAGPIPERISEGDAEAAARMFDELLADVGGGGGSTGTVTVVGCGPGDPDLLTFKALRHMQQADVAVHGADVPAAIVGRVRRDADHADAGADDILARIADWRAAGRTVVWLGPGDFQATDAGAEVLRRLGDAGLEPVSVAGVPAA